MIARTYSNPAEPTNAQTAKELTLQVVFVTLSFMAMALMLALVANVIA